jgi:5-methylcytosine-specific restriction protein A
MPHAPGTRCSDPTCGELATHHGRCETHQRKPWANPSQHTRLIDPTQYNHWRQQVIRASNGRCAVCGQPGKITDHITPVGEGGALYDPDNGQYLCKTHNDDKTREDIQRMATRRRLTP